MADDKKYYYLKLKDNFFDSDQMIVLESMPDGHLYSNILLKIYLRSLKSDGKLMFNERIPYTPTILARVVRHPVGVVEKAISIFKELCLVEELDNGAIYVSDIQNYIGRSSTEADRKRIYRDLIEQERRLLVDKCPDNSPPEKEIELEIELKREIKKKDIDNFFESVWSLYPLKKGKAGVSETQKKKLYAIGYDELKRAIERYDSEVKDKQYMKHGSTFFNGGYVDYLDANYQEPEKKDEPDRYDNAMFRAIGRGVTNV